MDKYGWIVALERAAHLDAGGKSLFTVNLVRPWCDAETAANPRGPEVPDARIKTGTLWLPWRWEKPTEWVTYGRFNVAGQLVWKAIAATVSAPGASVALDNDEAIGEAIADEINLATEMAKFPLSSALEDLQTLRCRSHVHALAPLTHWPARLSSGVLRLTWLLDAAEDVFIDCEAVVCFPKFKMDPGTIVTEAQQEPKAISFTDYADAPGKPGFIVEYKDNNVAFVALAADPRVIAASLPADGLQLSQGAVSRSAVHTAFASKLLPLPVLLAWIDQNQTSPAVEADQQALVRALWAILGFGREYLPAKGQRPNIVEFLVAKEAIADAAVLRNAIETNIQPVPDAIGLAALGDVANELDKTKSSSSWTAERKSVWNELQLALKRLRDGAAKTAEQFRKDWIPLAVTLAGDDGLTDVMGLWLASVLDPLFVTKPEKDAWAPVRAKLARVGEFRKDLVLRAQPFLVSTVLWEAARKAVGKPDGDPSIAALETATLAALRAALGPSAAMPVKELETAVKEKVKQFRFELVSAADQSRPRPRDRGLKLDFSGFDSSAAAGSDQQIRGYAIGLCSGYIANVGDKWEPDRDRARWLTDTAVLVNNVWATQKSTKPGAKLGDTETAWMHEAVGATAANGEKLVSVEYEGAPVATALSVAGTMEYAGADPDGFRTIDFAWKDDDRTLPLLGYGLYYAARATPLDNVGAVIDQTLRGAHVTELKEAEVALSSLAAPLQYLSSEAPGAPDSSAIEAGFYELSDETQARAWQLAEIAKAKPTDRVPTLAKVVLLATADTVKIGSSDVVLFPQAKRQCVFDVSAHGTHGAFIERWLATDRLLVEHKEEASDAKLGTEAKLIETFAAKFLEKPGPRTTPNARPYHPAVSAIGVELVLYGKTAQQLIVAIDRVTRDSAGLLAAAEDKVKVSVVAAAAGAPKLTATNKSVQLDLPRGSFACLRFYALVAEKHFKPGSSEQRYAQGLNNTKGIIFKDFRAFSPSELWFETIPAWPPAGLPESDVKINLLPPRDTPEGSLSPNMLVANLEFPVVVTWAQWLKGAYLQRHEWHWTGYPVDFPGEKDQLPAWIPTLAGVESFREIIDVDFTTAFAANDWRIGVDASGKAVVHRWALAAGTRPARYVAYLARPMLRFRRWLNQQQLGEQGPFTVEKHLYASGTLVPGRMPERPLERLATPALRHSVPLTATYSPQKGLRRGQNGVMLVFEDAIRRTDDLARVGGLGDTIEIDLVDTRVEGVSEIGNNPIFHGLEPQPKSGSLATDPAFGLTFDIGPNPKVAQTAIVVRPLNAGGRWVMAMARARRLILPETELATALRADAEEGPPGHLAVIPTRLDGKDVVPLDFVVDVVVPLQKSLRLDPDGDADPRVVAVPRPPATDPKITYRYLISWHKARWADGGEPKWRCQVMLQSRPREGRLAWDTLPGTVRGFQSGDSELRPGTTIERWFLSAEVAAANAQVRRIRISDYTDPRWLTFIGSFGNENPGMARDYRFVVRNGKLDMLELSPDSRSVGLPNLRNLSASLGGSDPTFHLALVFRAVPDVVRLRTEEGTGELVACYFVDSKVKPIFLPRATGDTPPTSLDGCYAHVLTLQRINSLRTKEKDKSGQTEQDLINATTLNLLLECAFPAQDLTATESLLRILPEYLGPIPIRA